MSIRSYVVRYDSGFAPNPFYDYCTLATCRADIRRDTKLNDWLLGCGSDKKKVRLGGRIVYAMRVTETLTFDQYDADPRFASKKPFRRGSRKQSCGDNIYSRASSQEPWNQRDSFHSNSDGSRNASHLNDDTRTNRVLISDDFVYFGGEGPLIPANLRASNGTHIGKSGVGQSKFDEVALIDEFVSWVRSLDGRGYQGMPFEWISLRAK